MSIQQQVVLRYRSAGHVRFSLPVRLCQADAVERLVSGLYGTEGVYRVDLLPRQRKLSIRYIADAIDFKRLSAALSTLIAQIESAAPAATGTGITRQHRADSPAQTSGWVREKYQELKETISALGVVSRNAVGRRLNASNGKFVSEFLTDVLVLYLIKTHWHLITQHWLKRPWQYRYEWMAALYMIFLLVSSKKPKS